MLSADPQNSRLLATLPAADFERLLREGTIVSRAAGTILCETGDMPESVCFPSNGIIALTVVMRNERSVQAAMIGRDGVFAGMIGLGIYTPIVRSIVHTASDMLCIPAPAFRKLCLDSAALTSLCIRSNDLLLAQAFIAAACAARHSTESRSFRLLLEMSDCVGDDVVAATQESLSEMLGVRRTTITDIATKLQAAEISLTRRGRMTILDRSKLQALACNCYTTLRDRDK